MLSVWHDRSLNVIKSLLFLNTTVKNKAFEPINKLNMKDILFRSPLMNLPILTIFLVSIYGCESTSSFYSTGIRSYKEMNFKFEDYDVKSLEIVREKLAQLFPKGSSLSEFKNAMKQSGANCEGNNPVYCRHQSGKNPLVKSKWIVKVEIGNDNSIEELAVTAGFVGV
jgi:hypothetical protein